MAPFAFDLLDEEQKKKQEQEGSDSAPAMTGGGETFEGASGQPNLQQNTQQKGTNKQGSGFVGLDQYISANKGNNFGNQFTGKVQGDVDSAKQSLAKNSSDFTQASNQGTTRWNDISDSAKGIVDQAGSGTTADDMNKYKGWTSAQYQGPESFTGSAYGTQVQGATQKATQEANALQSEGGRFALLDQFFGRPKYNLGEKSLDNLLVQSAPGTAARAASINNQSKQLQGNVNQSGQDLNNLVTANKFATQEAANQAQGLASGAIGNFQSDIDKAVTDYNSSRDDLYSRIGNDVYSGNLNDEERQIFGDLIGQRTYGVNLSDPKYYSKGADATAQTIATPEQYAKYLALAQLAGVDPTYLSEDNLGLAGSALTGGPKVDFNSDLFKSDQLSGIRAYNEALQPLQSQADVLNQQLAEQKRYLENLGHNNTLGAKDYNAELQHLNSRIADIQAKLLENKRQQDDVAHQMGADQLLGYAPAASTRTTFRKGR